MNKGRWGGILSILVVSKLMGCSYYLASKALKRLQSEIEFVTLDDIGNLIYEHRKKVFDRNEDTILNKYFFDPVIRL